MLKRLITDLQSLGVRPGGILLVHSSLSSLGRINGGPETVIRALLGVLGPSGTLLLPALSYDLVTPDMPVFDLLQTGSNIGAIPEYFRQRAGTIRSIHPTHSVCGVGPEAESLLSDHYLDTTPAGQHSPFRKLRDRQGQILMLGCGLRPNTSMHAIEELTVPPYLFGSEQVFSFILPGTKPYKKAYTCHNFHGWEQRYDRVAGVLPPFALRTGTVLQARAHLIEAAVLWERSETQLRENPLYFVDRIPGKQT